MLNPGSLVWTFKTVMPHYVTLQRLATHQLIAEERYVYRNISKQNFAEQKQLLWSKILRQHRQSCNALTF